MNKSLDQTDRTFIDALIHDARISMRDLADLTQMSAPGVKERVRRLEQLGIIDAYTLTLNHRAMGYGMQAIVRVKPLPGQLHKVEELIREMQQCIECDKVTGEDCFVARLCLQSIDDLDPLLTPLSDRAETSTSIVKATTVSRRNPPLPQRTR